MKLTSVLDQMAAFVHSVSDFARSAPTNVWAMCAFAAAASILVTLVTLLLWPRGKAVEARPVRDPVDASGVRMMATTGVSVPEIARRTGLSHDAVSTILRAGALSRGDRYVPGRKTRPSAA